MHRRSWVGIAVVVSALYACSDSGGEGPTQGGASGAGTPQAGTAGATPNGGTGGADGPGGQSGSAGATAGGSASAGMAGAAPGGTSSGGSAASGAGAGGSSGADAGASNGGNGGTAGATTAGAGGVPPSGGTGGAAPSCDAALSTANRTLAAKAIDQLFVQKDIEAVDAYWADPYLQHNPIAKSGVSTFRSLMGGIVSSGSFQYTPLLTLAECDLAVVLGRYSQTGVIFDMFRIKDGKIMEHWDSDSNQASETTGLGMRVDGPSAENKALFMSFANEILIGGDKARASEFLSADYVEHHGTQATGPTALTGYLTSENVTYSKVHHVIADGNFVFAISEGKRGSTSFAFYDLFRADGGKLVEHWDSRRSVPASTQSGLPIF